MIKLKINNTAIEVESGMSILEAAKGLGLDIPVTNNTSLSGEIG